MADKNIWGVVSLLLLVSLTRQTLTVYNYASLKADNKVLLDIPYSIANFGFVP